MAVTRSWEAPDALTVEAVKPPVPVSRRRELIGLLCASLLVSSSLYLVFAAKTRDLKIDGVLNLNAVNDPSEIAPFLETFADSAERTEAAEAIYRYLERARPIPNVGAVARVRIGKSAFRRSLARLKPFFIVRSPAEFRRQFFLWMGIYFAGFYIVHLCWRLRRFNGDGSVLPAIHLLTGFGITLAVGIRDPLRDTLEFTKFGWGVAGGCALLLLPLLKVFDYRKYSRWIYTPLLMALGLFAALMAAGSGPTGSDSKVNLGPLQPVEAIKVLLVFFMAGYFASKWEWLRDLRERRLRWLDLPRFRHVLPVIFGTACALAFFFLLKDLGPALVTGFLFLCLFAVARGRAGLAVLGVALLAGGVAAGYRMGSPHTVVDRISMWTSPWDNNVRGGDQIAHSFWALATGGPFGSGPGLGDPGMIPAGHTDLVLPAIGEEFGYCGVVAIALLFVFLFHRALSAARRAPDDYGFYLAVGCGTLIALEMTLITAGVLGVLPLSGVVSPFLSAGNSAMLANFFVFAVILGISQRGTASAARRPLWGLTIPLGSVFLLLVAKAGYIQVVHDQDLIARDSKVIQEDGVKRPQHNPRLNSLARELPRGDILDRNGVVLATNHSDGRFYPYRAVTAHLIGDLKTGENFHASNSSLIEHDQNVKLQGFEDLHDLAPLVRYRHHAGNREMEHLKAKDRNVRTSIDIRLQQKAAEILEKHLASAGAARGALVAMNAATGEVLALVSAPVPQGSGATPDELLDRARYAQYPPGSTFKLVTALAALRLDPDNAKKKFHCAPLGDGRVGARIPGWNKPIRDDVGDHAHGSPDMARAIAVSCNAYFAQLGVSVVGSKALLETARLLDIPAGDLAEIRKMLPFAAYGQGPVLMTPFKMARVAATVAAGGVMPQGRWVIDDSNERRDAPKTILPEDRARFIAKAMRAVVMEGTARRAMAGLNVEVAGKTGTAQMDVGEPHSWFAGFAPYDAPPAKRIAFAVVVEHGGYGARVAAPIARDLVEGARDLGYF